MTNQHPLLPLRLAGVVSDVVVRYEGNTLKQHKEFTHTMRDLVQGEVLVRKADRSTSNIKKIIIHCTATRATQDITAQDVHTWHQRRGWSGIGYHYLIRRDGVIERGRALDTIGSHCRGENRDSVGIAYAGGVEEDGKTPVDNRTPAQKQSLKRLVHVLSFYLNIPVREIYGHHQFSAKACPSFIVPEWVLNDYAPWTKYQQHDLATSEASPEVDAELASELKYHKGHLEAAYRQGFAEAKLQMTQALQAMDPSSSVGLRARWG